ncbi:hypothetical protein [Fimbriiglobus ruber]|uniref:Immunity protein 35 domain-containing protein n=1 Tax=Fimbriiglobus ruber TaxID=1908690 RepID=A0A225DW73_9BACT|nr:hypothetical protein [Fimbriiglobus ruber]OWK45790.1 hypothetical protein FRUB_02121 [Fimbriiglobus ruber]
MTRDEAEREVLSFWGHTSEHDFCGPVRVDSDRTETYDWGWVVYVVPINPETCPLNQKYDEYAIHKETGQSTVVGTRGLEYAIYELKKVYTKPIDW